MAWRRPAWQGSRAAFAFDAPGEARIRLMQVKRASRAGPSLNSLSSLPLRDATMYKRLIFLAVLALPGSFFVLAALGIHPRGRALLAEVAGFGVWRSARSMPSPAMVRVER
jgi:hypothetical protein